MPKHYNGKDGYKGTKGMGNQRQPDNPAHIPRGQDPMQTKPTMSPPRHGGADSPAVPVSSMAGRARKARINMGQSVSGS